VDKSGMTTMVQGTRGYLDPLYFCTGRLTEKSDVYSFGVMLLELLTRKKPFSYLSSQGDGLVTHFATLFREGNFSQLLDPQVKDEGGKEVEEVAALAVACVKLTGEGRPTMRNVELTLEGLKYSKEHVLDNVVAADGIATNSPTTVVLLERKESSRQYSMEEEFMLSSRHPR
jgi:serine/threonine protein kinase